eukprot:CAMPEP_0114245264 /NCGR_PEP_ID=MMETSP0058-20121206/11792_1 /TAXON_ID=36894 /ORGANISM="Pyramimonas parkeae, CCMP726" /LENGTH=484 /DNA_ID=CAMNT_0001358283 /DNA_START=463 /DNA_END=1917 /DNA_ORIENTATION=+
MTWMKFAELPVHVVFTLIVGMILSLWLILSLVRSKGRPPVIAGMPLIGGFLKFIKGPMPLMEEAYAKYGSVFTVPLFHKRMTFLIGPEVSSHFFKASDLDMSQKEVYAFNVPTFGKGVVFDVDHTVRLEQFRFFAEALKKNKMRTYVGMMVQEAEAFFERWGEEGEVDLLEQLSDLIILTASRCLMGKEVREQLFEKVSELFHLLDLGMLPISVMFPYLPIKAHRNRDYGRKELSKIFSKIINNRRASGETETDVLQAFIDARYKNGKGLTDDEITGMLIAVLFAGQHTSSITSTWSGLYMLAYKSMVWPQALDEQRAVIAKHGDELNFDILSEMDHLHCCVKEALRLHPPLIMLMRYCHKEFNVTTKEGVEYTIPKGDIVATSPSFAHRLEHVFKDANKYDPFRYMEGREEDKAQPFSYIGFGGGRHGCMGEQFAYMQIKTIWSLLLRKFDMELVSPLPVPDYEAMVVGPKGKCTIRYKRRKL